MSVSQAYSWFCRDQLPLDSSKQGKDIYSKHNQMYLGGRSLKTALLVVILIALLLSGLTVTFQTVTGDEPLVPSEPHDANAMWVEPSTLELNINSTPVGQKFNVTIWTNCSVPCGGWQFWLVFESIYTSVERAGYTAGTKSDFLKNITTISVEPRFHEVNATHKRVEFGETWGGSGDFRNPGYGSLAWIEFSIIELPVNWHDVYLKFSRYAGDITRTYLIEGTSGQKVLVNAFGSVVTFIGEGPPPPPPPGTYTLTIVATYGGTTDPAPGEYAYEPESVASVTALPTSDYTFDHWVLDGDNVGNVNPISITMDADHTLQAVFTYSPPVPPTLPTSLMILGGGSRRVAGNGTSALYINWLDNWLAHHSTDGANWGPWPNQTYMEEWRYSVGQTLTEWGFNVDYAADMPESLEGYDLLVIHAYWAIEPRHEPIIRDFVERGGGIVLLSGVPCYFDVYCKDMWPYLCGLDLIPMREWLGASWYMNAGGAATIAVNNPFGLPLREGDFITRRGYSSAALTQLHSDTYVVAKWQEYYDVIFAYGHQYGEGRVYYQAEFESLPMTGEPPRLTAVSPRRSDNVASSATAERDRIGIDLSLVSYSLALGVGMEEPEHSGFSFVCVQNEAVAGNRMPDFAPIGTLLLFGSLLVLRATRARKRENK